MLLLSISLKIGSKKLDRRANELQVENTRTANQIELFGLTNQKQEPIRDKRVLVHAREADKKLFLISHPTFFGQD